MVGWNDIRRNSQRKRQMERGVIFQLYHLKLMKGLNGWIS